jgi:hypothetical protein
MSQYATDADLLAEAGEDYFALVPRAQVLASGNDGVFDPALPWVLVSAVDFGAQGVAVGQAVHLSGAPKTPAHAKFGASGETYIVGAVAGTSLTLQVPGLGLGTGQPPSGADGLTEVGFRVVTMVPQIVRISAEVDRAIAYGAAADAQDAEARKELTIWGVLGRRYLAQYRQTSDDVFKDKSTRYGTQYTTLLTKTLKRRSGGPVSGQLQPTDRSPLNRLCYPYRWW